MHPNYLASPHREGYFHLDWYDLYYRAFGDGDTVLLGLHGGPGGSSDRLAPLARLADDEVSVYLYDQFACGRSDEPAPGDFDRYTLEHYRDEVEQVRRSIDTPSLVLYGHSWGGILAQEYALAYPDRVDKLILASTLHDAAAANTRMKEARQDVLNEEEIEAVEALEARRAFDDEEYQALTEKVFDECVIRVADPAWREKEEPNIDLYGIMWGPSEFAMAETARLRDWSVKDQLGDIEAPTLVLVGEHDEIGPTVAADIAERIPDSRLEVLADASHFVFWERPTEHTEIVRDFLRRPI